MMVGELLAGVEAAQDRRGGAAVQPGGHGVGRSVAVRAW
jgi:hypothetical protein